MDRTTFDYTAPRRLAGLIRRLTALQETSLSAAQQVELGLAVAEARQLADAMARVSGPGDGAAVPAVFDGDPPTVLVVDDNPTNTTLLVEMLRTMGVSADTAALGERALAQLDETPYDLVFLDVMLPDLDGMDVVRRIRERHGRRPYVVGASALPGARDRALAEGMDAFLSKPLHLQDVAGAVRECVEAGRAA